MGSEMRRGCPCGRDYDASDWAGLPMTAHLAGQELARIVTPWPAHVVVEVRTCRCGRPISRLAGRVSQRPSRGARDEIATLASSWLQNVDEDRKGKRASS